MASLEQNMLIRRNKLLGMWAAEKLGLVDQEANAYSNEFVASAIDPARGDVLEKIRKDFDAAGVAQSDEQILQVMNDYMLEAAKQLAGTGDGVSDAAAVMIARKLTSR